MATKKALVLKEDAHRRALEEGILQTLELQRQILESQERVEELLKGLVEKREVPKTYGGSSNVSKTTPKRKPKPRS